MTVDDYSNACTHKYHHIAQSIQDLSDSTQQNNLHSIEETASLFADNATTPCAFNIIDQHSVTENANDTNTPCMPKPSNIHLQRKHTYRNTFGESNIQHHDFNNQDSLTFTDKYTALLQQELQNPYWNLHDPIMTKNYQISKDMDIETMPHATPIEIFIDNGATPSILPLHTYNKFPILHTYPRTESNTPIHTGGGLIKSHFWLEIPLKFNHQTIQIKALVCDSECPYDLILGWTSMAQLSAWQDYTSHKLTDLDTIDS